MVSRLYSRFRSGNIAEHLGILLLKGIAAIAEVPRQEDIGVDAVANLLQLDNDGNFYAEDSFVVQLKSKSLETIKYSGHSLTWLIDQKQPMFIGRVSLKDSTISLYPTLSVNQAVLALHVEDVIIKFRAFDGLFPWESGKNPNSAIVYLKEPILKWSVEDLSDKSWSKSSYEIMKKFLVISQREYELLSLGQCSQLEWKSNDKESIRSSFGMIKTPSDSLPQLVERCKPCITALLFQAVAMPEDTRNSLMIPLILLIKKFRDLGVDIDPTKLFEKLFFSCCSTETDNMVL